MLEPVPDPDPVNASGQGKGVTDGVTPKKRAKRLGNQRRIKERLKRQDLLQQNSETPIKIEQQGVSQVPASQVKAEKAELEVNVKTEEQHQQLSPDLIIDKQLKTEEIVNEECQTISDSEDVIILPNPPVEQILIEDDNDPVVSKTVIPEVIPNQLTPDKPVEDELHPYHFLVDAIPPVTNFEPEEISPPKPLDESEFEIINTLDGVLSMLQTLKTEKQLAMEVVTKSAPTYAEIEPFVIMISTDSKDYLIDLSSVKKFAVAMLPEVLMNPKILKVFFHYRPNAQALGMLNLFAVNIFEIDRVRSMSLVGTKKHAFKRCLKERYDVNPSTMFIFLPDLSKQIPIMRMRTHFTLDMYRKMRNQILAESHDSYSKMIEDFKQMNRKLDAGQKQAVYQHLLWEVGDYRKAQDQFMEWIYNWRDEKARELNLAPNGVLRITKIKEVVLNCGDNLEVREKLSTTQLESENIQAIIDARTGIFKRVNSLTRFDVHKRPNPVQRRAILREKLMGSSRAFEMRTCPSVMKPIFAVPPAPNKNQNNVPKLCNSFGGFPQVKGPPLPPPRSVPIIPPRNPVPIIPPRNPVPIIPPRNPVPIIPPQNPVLIIPPRNPVPIIPPQNPVSMQPRLESNCPVINNTQSRPLLRCPFPIGQPVPISQQQPIEKPNITVQDTDYRQFGMQQSAPQTVNLFQSSLSSIPNTNRPIDSEQINQSSDKFTATSESPQSSRRRSRTPKRRRSRSRTRSPRRRRSRSRSRSRSRRRRSRSTKRSRSRRSRSKSRSRRGRSRSRSRSSRRSHRSRKSKSRSPISKDRRRSSRSMRSASLQPPPAPVISNFSGVDSIKFCDDDDIEDSYDWNEIDQHISKLQDNFKQFGGSSYR